MSINGTTSDVTILSQKNRNWSPDPTWSYLGLQGHRAALRHDSTPLFPGQSSIALHSMNLTLDSQRNHGDLGVLGGSSAALLEQPKMAVLVMAGGSPYFSKSKLLSVHGQCFLFRLRMGGLAPLFGQMGVKNGGARILILTENQ